jgi:integral membrane sensor domain MASE1
MARSPHRGLARIYSAIAFIFFFGAIVCAVFSASGYYRYGNWSWPGWTIGSVLGLDTIHLSNFEYAQNLLNYVLPLNPGWLFLLLAILFALSASSRRQAD